MNKTASEDTREHFSWLKHCRKCEAESTWSPATGSLVILWLGFAGFHHWLFSPNANSRGQHYSLVQLGISFWKKTPYGPSCCLSERLFQDTSLALGIGPAVIGPVYLVGISAFLSHASYERPCFLALLQPDLFRGKLILLQKANAKINQCLLESGEVAGKRRLYKRMPLIPCCNQPPPIHITAAQNWEQPPLPSCAQ